MIIPGIPIYITENELLSKLSEEQIANRYIKNFKTIGKAFNSEFRKDNSPSCFVFLNNGRLKYKDFGNPFFSTMISMIEYVSYKYNEPIQASLNRISKDFGIISDGKSYSDEKKIGIYNHKEKIISSSSLKIEIKKREWTKEDIKYWRQYYIPIEMLERNNICSISNYWLFKDNKQILSIELSKTHPSFSYNYYWNENIFRRKIYRPYSKEYKWISNTDYTIVQNYLNIPKFGDLLFIQSSYKDCMVMELLGYYAIAPNAEGVWLAKNYWEKIKTRWDKIVIFGNNDWEKTNNPGLIYAKKHSEKYKIPYIVNPYKEPSDISDYVKINGLEKGKILIERLLKIYDIY